MLARQIKPCVNCPYKPIDIQITGINGVRINIFDIDLVFEIGKRIEAIAELKRYPNAASYRYFEFPAHELVGYKKVAKCLKCDLYLIVFDGCFYYLAEVDRFKKYDTEINGNGQKVIRFPREEFRVLTESEFQQFWVDIYGFSYNLRNRVCTLG